MIALGVDTSNYATSLAVVNTTTQEVVCAKKRFLPVAAGGTGLRQSDAVFHHTVALPQMLQEINDLPRVQAIGVSSKPRSAEGSYMPCFLAGVSFATAFATGANIPLVQTSHQDGHVAAALYGAQNPSLYGREVLLFHVSGGTTELLLVKDNSVLQVLGSSRDLYAGQAVDRLGVKLGYAFPAGEEVSSLALQCADAPTPKISVKGMDCHLSGLQNQCEALLSKGETPAFVAKYCLYSIADTIVAMVKAAREKYPQYPLVCAGGVMSSRVIRPRIEAKLNDVWFAPPALSADNAVGVALIAAQKVKGE